MQNYCMKNNGGALFSFRFLMVWETAVSKKDISCSSDSIIVSNTCLIYFL